MSNTATARAGRNAPLFAWLGPLARLAELGTEGYPRPARRQMAIVNLMAVLIAVFSAVYAIVFAFYGMDVYLHLIVVNLLLVAVALLVPLAHRISDIAGALLIAIAEFAALFYFVRALGHDFGHPDQLHHRRCGRLRHLRHDPLPAHGRGDRDRPRAASCRLVPLSAGTRADRRPSGAARQSLRLLRGHHLRHDRADRRLRLHPCRPRARRG